MRAVSHHSEGGWTGCQTALARSHGVFVKKGTEARKCLLCFRDVCSGCCTCSVEYSGSYTACGYPFPTPFCLFLFVFGLEFLLHPNAYIFQILLTSGQMLDGGFYAHETIADVYGFLQSSVVSDG